MYVGLHAKYVFFFEIYTELEFTRQISKKHSNIKFHEHPSNGSRVVSCGQTDRRDVSVAFQQFSGAPTNIDSSGVPRNFFSGGGFQQIQLRTKDRE